MTSLTDLSHRFYACKGTNARPAMTSMKPQKVDEQYTKSVGIASYLQNVRHKQPANESQLDKGEKKLSISSLQSKSASASDHLLTENLKLAKRSVATMSEVK